jgi:hypothetical protein
VKSASPNARECLFIGTIAFSTGVGLIVIDSIWRAMVSFAVGLSFLLAGLILERKKK